MMHPEMGNQDVVGMIARAWGAFGTQDIPTMVLVDRMKTKKVNGGTSEVVILVCVERVASAYDCVMLVVSLYPDVRASLKLTRLWYSGLEGNLCGFDYDEKVTMQPLIAKSLAFAVKMQESLGWACLVILEKEEAS